MAAIDGWLPRYDVHERHEIDLPIPPERALELVLSLPAAWTERMPGGMRTSRARSRGHRFPG